MNSPSLSIAIPFFNESAGAGQVITGLVQCLKEKGIAYQVVAVDNGSKDDTGEILRRLAEADQGVTVVSVPENRGYGFGIRAGLAACAGAIIGYLDGDGQVSAEDLVHVYRALAAGEADFAKARRLTRGDSINRRLVSWIFNLLFRWLFNTEALDVNAKPKLFRRTLLPVLALTADDWFIDAELMLKIARLNVRTLAVDVHFYQRPTGKSHVRFAAIVEFVKNLLRYRCGRLRSWEEKALCEQ